MLCMYMLYQSIFKFKIHIEAFHKLCHAFFAIFYFLPPCHNFSHQLVLLVMITFRSGSNGEPRVARPPHALALATPLAPSPQSGSAYKVLAFTGPFCTCPGHPAGPLNIKSLDLLLITSRLMLPPPS